MIPFRRSPIRSDCEGDLMIQIFALIAFIFVGQSASAKVLPYCGASYRSDSTGIGVLDAVLGGTATRPVKFSQSCYDLGMNYGNTTLASCRGDLGLNDFKSGVADGQNFSNNGSTDNCYQAGYGVGVNLLHIAAREQHADSECNDYYNRGYENAQTGAAQPSDRISEKSRECYNTGFSDFGNLP